MRGGRRALPCLLAALVAGLLAFLAMGPAASEVVIAITPTRIPLSMAPEESQSMQVTLINQGTEEVSLQPRVMTLAEGQGGEPLLGQDSTCSWFSPDQPVLHLMPTESGPFAFLAMVPAGAEPGVYHFALAFELVRKDGQGIGLTGGLAVLIDLEVLPEPSASVAGFPTALTIVLVILAVLLMGLIAAYALHRHGRGRESEPATQAGGEER